MKAKVPSSTLPLPCILCLGYIWGIATSPWGALCTLSLVFILPFFKKEILFFLLIGSLVGLLWTNVKTNEAQQRLAGLDMTPKSIEGIVVQGAERAGNKVLMTVRSDKDLLRVEARTFVPTLPGDLVSLRGRFSPLEMQEDSTFNYPLYLAKNGISGVFQSFETRVLQEGQQSPERMLGIVRRQSLGRIGELWPGDAGGLIAGILVGARGSFSEELVETMRVTGLMHIVAVSGFNMTILINTVLHLTGMLAFRWRVFLASGVLVLFTLFVGPSGAVVRACLMGIIALIAKLYARPATAFLCLIYAGALMLFFSPLDLLYDIGFQLSFLAVLGLLWGEPALAPWCFWIPKGIRGELQTTLAAILWTLPVSIVYFGNISLIAPLANLLVPPSIPLLMLGGFIVFCCSWIPFLTPFTWMGTYLVLLWTNGMLWISTVLGAIPHAAVSVELPIASTLPFTIMAYSILGAWSWKTYKKRAAGDIPTTLLLAPP